MVTLVAFKLVFRGEAVWVNPDEVRAVQRRSSGTIPQTCLRFAGLPDAAEMVVEGTAEEAVQKLTGAAPPAKAVRPTRSEPLNPGALKALMEGEPS